jgi:6-phosphogluconolactonase (cycloisomerase 2 family)
MGQYNKSTGSFTPEVGSFYSFSKDWKPTKHISKVTVSNGLAWSEDLKTMYYIDSVTKKVDAFDFDAENAKICEYSCFNTLHENIYFSFMFRTSMLLTHLHLLSLLRIYGAFLPTSFYEGHCKSVIQFISHTKHSIFINKINKLITFREM